MKLATPGLAIVSLALSVAIAAPASAARKDVRGEPEEFELTKEEKAVVATGGISVRHRNPRGAINEFFSAGYIEAPVDKVFAYYEDHNNTKKFQNAIKELDVVIDERGEKSGYRQLKYALNLPFPIGWRRFVLDLNGKGEPGEWGNIWWSLNDGDINEMLGSYVMTKHGPNRTLMRYHVMADMNTWLPSWLIGFIQRGTIPHVIEQGRKDLEK